MSLPRSRPRPEGRAHRRPAGAIAGGLLASASLLACGVKPPPSQFPSGQAALDRLRATYACARGVRGEGKIDYLSDKTRVRAGVMLYAVAPELVRFDVVSPFGVTVSTLTSDGHSFALLDLREKRFYEGPSSPCNIARLTHVPIPGHALIELLHGEAPVLLHDAGSVGLRWSGGGFYELSLASTRGARETLRLAPAPADFARPYAEQRLRVLDVRVEQQGYLLYHAELKDFAPAQTAGPMIDEAGVDPPVPPSGPACTVDVPRAVHVEVPGSGDDVVFRYKDVALNPPLPDGVFAQPAPGGVAVVPAGPCDG